MPRIRTEFPHRVREIENAWIPLKDGTRLAARIWLPEDAETNPVPALFEFLPYRKSDGTVIRDFKRQPYFAGHGYAAVRVDIRGRRWCLSRGWCSRRRRRPPCRRCLAGHRFYRNRNCRSRRFGHSCSPRFRRPWHRRCSAGTRLRRDGTRSDPENRFHTGRRGRSCGLRRSRRIRCHRFFPDRGSMWARTISGPSSC